MSGTPPEERIWAGRLSATTRSKDRMSSETLPAENTAGTTTDESNTKTPVERGDFGECDICAPCNGCGNYTSVAASIANYPVCEECAQLGESSDDAAVVLAGAGR